MFLALLNRNRGLRHFRLLAAMAGFFLCACHAAGQSVVTEELRIPAKGAGSLGLDALMVRPNDSTAHPLVLMTHGSPRDASERAGMTPFAMQPQAIEFARRGWTVVVVMRRGFGESGGSYDEDAHACGRADFVGATEEAVAQLRDAIAYLSKRPEVDASRIIGVGVSTGGMAMVALSADPPPGLVSAISFAGGRGSQAPDVVCNADLLVDAFGTFGKHSRVPMLWVYSQNDHFFGPQLAQRFYHAFTIAGGNASFVLAPPFRKDGHALFSVDGIPIWTPMVDEFLKSQNLALREALLPPLEPPKIDAPSWFPANLRAEFSRYLLLPPHKALAISDNGHHGFAYGRRTVEDAEKKALENCREFAAPSGKCAIAMRDEAVTR